MDFGKILCVLGLFSYHFSFAQPGMVRCDTIKVFKGATAIKNPWAGGLNFTEWSKIDLDLDGLRDLAVFDKSGNKIWESVQTINDESDFNANQNVTNLKLSLTIRDEKMLLSITSPSEKKGYIQYSFINKMTGNVIKFNKIGFNVSAENKAISSGKFINSYFNNIGYEKKALDSEGLIAQENNLLFSNYLNTIQNNQKLFFKTFYAKNGIWLLETDNTGYFKTSFFKE